MGSTREINGQTYDVIEASSVIFFWKDESEALECDEVSVVFTGDRYIIESLRNDSKVIVVQADGVLYAEIEVL